MKYLKELWNKFKLWMQWKRRINGKPIVDLTRTAGYFFPVGLIGYDPLKKEHLIDMKSGKLMITKLLDYELCRDPNDMIKWARYQYLGYQDETRFADMTWEEFHAAHYY